MNAYQDYDPSFHTASSVAGQGRCSQHGGDTCSEPPVVSFVDRHNRRQSGCERARDELLARGELGPPTEP